MCEIGDLDLDLEGDREYPYLLCGSGERPRTGEGDLRLLLYDEVSGERAISFVRFDGSFHVFLGGFFKRWVDSVSTTISMPCQKESMERVDNDFLDNRFVKVLQDQVLTYTRDSRSLVLVFNIIPLGYKVTLWRLFRSWFSFTDSVPTARVGFV